MNAFRLQAGVLDGAVILVARVMGIVARKRTRAAPDGYHIVRAARSGQSES